MFAEAVTSSEATLQKKVFLKISQNSQRNTSVGVSLNPFSHKVADVAPAT